MASIPPLTAIAEALTTGTEIACCTELLASESPHNKRLAPSQLRKLKDAKIILVDGSEAFAPRILNLLEGEQMLLSLDNYASHTGNRSKALEAAAAPPIGDEHHDHSAEHDHQHHQHDEGKQHGLHRWLNSQRMLLLAERLGLELQTHYPRSAQKVVSNLAAFRAELAETDASIAKTLAEFSSSADAPELLELHRALPEFASYYGIDVPYFIRDENDQVIGAKAFADLLGKVNKNQNRFCLLASWQHRDEAKRMAKRLNIRLSYYHLLQLPEAGSYPAYLRQIGDSISACSKAPVL